MDLKMIGLYALAGYGAYALYERFMAEEKTSSFRGTGWQQAGLQGTGWQKYNEFTGTRWQQDVPVGTQWQRRGVFSNANGNGAYSGTPTLQGTNWQRANMSNACGACA